MSSSESHMVPVEFCCICLGTFETNYIQHGNTLSMFQPANHHSGNFITGLAVWANLRLFPTFEPIAFDGSDQRLIDSNHYYRKNRASVFRVGIRKLCTWFELGNFRTGRSLGWCISMSDGFRARNLYNTALNGFFNGQAGLDE